MPKKRETLADIVNQVIDRVTAERRTLVSDAVSEIVESRLTSATRKTSKNEQWSGSYKRITHNGSGRGRKTNG